MYQFPDIFELKMVGVAEAGVPNKERVMFQVWDYGPVDLAPYFLTVGWKMPGGGGLPSFDGLCWLGDFQVAAGQWLFVYTGPGSTRSSVTTDGDPLHVVHWGREKTLFHTDGVIPILFRAGAVAVERAPSHILPGPQLPLLPTGLPATQRGDTGSKSLADLMRLANDPSKPPKS